MKKQAVVSESVLRFRHRKAFTLIEVLVTIIISAMLISGFGYLLYDTAEQMHIQWQLREAEEFGYYYVNEFSNKMRSGWDVDITRVTEPCEAEVTYVYPEDADARPHRFEFEYDVRAGMPQIRIDDVVQVYPYWDPQQLGPRDEIFIDPEAFYISNARGTGDYAPQSERFDRAFIQISFEILYRHYSAIPGRQPYEQVLTFKGTAYVTNENWYSSDDMIEPTG